MVGCAGPAVAEPKSTDGVLSSETSALRPFGCPGERTSSRASWMPCFGMIAPVSLEVATVRSLGGCILAGPWASTMKEAALGKLGTPPLSAKTAPIIARPASASAETLSFQPPERPCFGSCEYGSSNSKACFAPTSTKAVLLGASDTSLFDCGSFAVSRGCVVNSVSVRPCSETAWGYGDEYRGANLRANFSTKAVLLGALDASLFDGGSFAVSRGCVVNSVSGRPCSETAWG